MKATRLTFYILLTALAWTVGCAVFVHHSDPLKGWNLCWSQDPNDLNKAIKADYQDYIRNLSAKKRSRIGDISLFEDGKGQHAVKIEVGLNGIWYEHILIYNKENVRIKVIAYSDGRYSS